jgi:sugar phosphate isomerase/epimerase
MGGRVDRQNFLTAVRVACEIAQILDEHGVRKRGIIRIDSAEHGVDRWRKNPVENTKLIAETFREAGKIAGGTNQRLAAEGEICWAGMHSWKDMLDLLEAVDMPGVVGFQADLAHTYLYLMGYNAPEHVLLQRGYSDAEFWPAYQHLVSKLGPWTIDFHVAQNDGTVKGAGTHDKTGRHCMPDDPSGKLDIVRCARLWIEHLQRNGFTHICWDVLLET